MSSPAFRISPFASSTADKLYLYGGWPNNPEQVHVYSVSTERWKNEITEGPHPPDDLHDGACAVANGNLFLYGGNQYSSHFGALYQVNTADWSWRELSNCAAGGPGKKIDCKMIAYKNLLVLVGGQYDIVPETKQPGASYDDLGYTNEIHCYNLTTGLWSSPSVKGSRPPPTAGFSLTMIDKEHAVMFGGKKPPSADVHVLHLPTMTWTLLPHEDGDPRPKGRSNHTAVCLGYGGQHKRVLVSGGLHYDLVLNKDMWLLDPQSGRWEQVEVSTDMVIQSHGHIAASFIISQECEEVVEYGKKKDHSVLMSTAAMRFELQEISSGGKSWVLTDFAEESQLGSPERLAEKKKLMESFSTSKNECDSDVGVLHQQLEELKRRAEESDRRAEESDRRAEKLQRRIEELEKSNTDDEVLDKQGFLSVGEATATYTGKSTDIKSDELGIHVHLPDQNLPPGVTECPVSVSVAVSGEFDLPGKSELVSGVYKIDSSFVPKKPVTIRMQHCATEDGIGNLSFASSTDTAPPYAYKYIKKGKFTSTHGEIEIGKFCYYTILEKHGKKGLLSLYQKKYQLSLHCSKNPTIERPSCLSWNLFFTMVKNCSIFQRSIDRYFRECDAGVEQLADVVVKFRKDSQDVVLVLEGDRVEVQQGWSVIPLVTCCIQKNEVDNYADGRPPQFRLILMQSGNDNPSDLLHKFKLKGVEDSECFIKLFKPVPSREGIIMGPSHKIQYERYLKEINEVKRSALDLEIKDDGHLCQIADVLQNWQEKYYLLDLKLNPDVHDIRCKYRDSPVLQKHEVLYLWRNKSVDPTYNSLLKICAQAGWRDSARVIITIINKN